MRLRRRWFPLATAAAIVATVSVAPPVGVGVGGPVDGIDVANMDRSVDPGVDFYRFVNGGWLDRTEIPADEGSYGVFNELDDATTAQLLELLDGLAAGGDVEPGSDEWKAVQFFAQGVDVDTRNAQGIDPIQPILDEIEAIGTVEEFHDFQRGAGFRFLTALFGVFVIPDLIDSSVHAAYLSGPFFGLPNRDYYLEDSDDNRAVGEAYVASAAELLGYVGYDPVGARHAAEAVYELEQRLVEPTLTREEQQDIALFHNPMTVAELEATYPAMDWADYLGDLGLSDVESLVVTERNYLEALGGIIASTDLETLKAWVKLELLWSFANHLSEEIEGSAFDFRGRVLEGVTEQDPLEERVLAQLNGVVGDAIGRLYVAEYFPPEAKMQITVLVDELIAAFRQRLAANTWMSADTKQIALAKLDKLAVKVGYPDEWRSYAAVDIEDSYAATFLNATTVEYSRTLRLTGQPVDPAEWSVPAQEVNAFYDWFNNDITFPAAILQPPFFDYRADPAVNFGGIGFVIGHEITHGFDLQGSQFDADGNLANWWTEVDAAAFQALNDEVVALYEAVEVAPKLFIDGQITVTENVADLGGIQVAHDALDAYLDEHGNPGIIDSFTPEQRFFISAASVWREEIRPEALETLVHTDVHAPSSIRGTVPLQNVDEFHQAFDIGPGDRMYLPPNERIVIW
jgi:predicted metalloendopeptidase